MPETHPQSLVDFERRFATEEACRAYLEGVRWQDGYRCPRCRGEDAWVTRRGLRSCKQCGHQASVTAGTVFGRSHTPLTTWFRAMWWMTTQKTGASALGLQRVLGLGTYRTAWTCLHKLRRAMVRPGRDALTGRVEVDETFVGGAAHRRGRHVGSKALVFVAAEVRRRAIGRIRLLRIPDASAESIAPAVQACVAKGAVVISDGWPSYEMLSGLGYRHEARIVEGSGRTASSRLPRVHRVAALLKRWLLGTHQGAVRREHLDYYLDEFTFRFNRRASADRGKLFARLVEQAIALPPTTFADLHKGSRSPGRTRRHKG